MALVRKIVIVLVGISLALLLTALLLNPDSLTRLATNVRDASVFIRLPLAILVDAFILAIIVIFVRGDRSPRSSDGLMVKAQGAIADVSVESARDRILRAVRDVPDVLSAEATVKPVRGKADVDLEVVVSHDSANVPEKQREIDRALRQVINKQLGLQMAGKPRVHIRMDDERLLAEPPVTPVPVPVPPAESVVPVVEPTVVPESPLAVTEATPPESVDFAQTLTSRVERDSEADESDLPPLG